MGCVEGALMMGSLRWAAGFSLAPGKAQLERGCPSASTPCVNLAQALLAGSWGFGEGKFKMCMCKAVLGALLALLIEMGAQRGGKKQLDLLR